MPYRRIHWIKLEIRLLNDPRFFTMSEKSQLIYIKILLLCGQFKNLLPRSYPVLKELLRTSYTEKELNDIIKEIRDNFPKLLSKKDYYYIKGFKEMHNWVAVKELPGNSQGDAMEVVDKEEEQKKNKTYTNEQHTFVINEFIRVKKWDFKNVPTGEIGRYRKSSKALLKLAQEDLALITQGIEWMNSQNFTSWTIETVVKWWPEFMKLKENPLANDPMPGSWGRIL